MLKRIYKKIKKTILPLTDREMRVRNWKKSGSERLRYIYDLNSESIVFDLGGYKGQWSSDIFSMYMCKIYVFEPVKKYYENIVDRFSKNNNIRVYSFGLSNSNTTMNIGLADDESSLFDKKSAIHEKVILKKASDFLHENGIQKIDLIKMNIEGGEYDLLENLIESGFIKICKNVQIQFHDFVPNAQERMLKTRKMLSNTHEATYQSDFVWENWQIKNHQATKTV